MLNSTQRVLVEQTIKDHCNYRNWLLHAVNCRTNHVHVVVSADIHPRRAREQLKAWSARRLREQSHELPTRQKWWTERGSERYINDERGLEDVVHYVLFAQDKKTGDARRAISVHPQT